MRRMFETCEVKVERLAASDWRSPMSASRWICSGGTPRAWDRPAATLEVTTALTEAPDADAAFDVVVDADATPPRAVRSGVVRTARKLFDGTAFPRGEATT